MAETPTPALEVQLREAREVVRRWLMDERIYYSDRKYDSSLRQLGVDKLREEGLGNYWDVFITNYYGRVRLFDPRTPQGKQALGKLIVTLTSLMEAAVVVDPTMPQAGVASGEGV